MAINFKKIEKSAARKDNMPEVRCPYSPIGGQVKSIGLTGDGVTESGMADKGMIDKKSKGRKRYI